MSGKSVIRLIKDWQILLAAIGVCAGGGAWAANMSNSVDQVHEALDRKDRVDLNQDERISRIIDLTQQNAVNISRLSGIVESERSKK